MLDATHFLKVVMEKKPEDIKAYLEDVAFKDLSNDEKLKILTTEDELGCSVLPYAATRSANHLSTILNSNAILELGEDKAFKLISHTDCGNNTNLLNLAIRLTPKHIYTLLNSKLISKLTQEHLLTFLTGSEIDEQPLGQSIATSLEHMNAMLDNEAVERLDPDSLLIYLTGQEGGVQPITLAMKKSIGIMEGFLNSKAIERLDATKVFEFLTAVVDKIEGNALLWYTVVNFTCEHIEALLNSNAFDKLSTSQSNQILSFLYERSNEENPLNYALNYKPVSCVESIVNSQPFKKLGAIEIEAQFKMRDTHQKAVLDIAVAKSPDYLKVLLESCLSKVSDDQKIMILNSKEGLSMSPFSTIVYSNPTQLGLLLNSKAISSMDQLHISELFQPGLPGTSYNLGGNLIDEIKNKPEKLIILLNSNTFKTLDDEHKVDLIGEGLFDQVNTCLTADQQQYITSCISELF